MSAYSLLEWCNMQYVFVLNFLNFTWLINLFTLKCIALKKSYSTPCSSLYECNDAIGLTCPSMIGSCNCPLASTTIFCDCQRTVNNEYFWNGTACQSAASLDESCLNSSTSYMCQTLTQGTICNGTAFNFTCQCPYLKYFDQLTNSCQNQLSFNNTCSINEMCLSVIGLSCISSKCE